MEKSSQQPICSSFQLPRDGVVSVRMKSIRWISNQNSSSHISHHCGLFRKIQRNKWMDREIEPHRRRTHYIYRYIHWRRKSKWVAQVKCIKLLCLYIILFIHYYQYFVCESLSHSIQFNSSSSDNRIAIRSLENTSHTDRNEIK